MFKPAKRFPATSTVLVGAIVTLAGLMTLWLMTTRGPTVATLAATNALPHEGADSRRATETLHFLPVSKGPEESPVHGDRAAVASPSDSETVVALEGKYVEHLDWTTRDLSLDGYVDLVVRVEAGEVYVRAPVRAGHFKLRLRRVGEGYETLDGAQELGDATKVTSIRATLPITTTMEVFAHFDPAAQTISAEGTCWPFGTQNAAVALRRAVTVELEVLDAESRLPVQQIQVHATPKYGSSRVDASAWDGRLLMESATSPALLRPTGHLALRERAQFRISAEGYAQSHVTLDLTRTHRKEVHLVRSGGLRIQLNGPRPPGSFVRLMRRRTVSERSAQAPEFVYDNLAPGTYKAQVLVEAQHSARCILAAADVDVTSGTEAQLTLTLEPSPPVVVTELTGQLRIPPAWAIEAPRLNVNLRSSSLTGRRKELTLANGGLRLIPHQEGMYSFTLNDLEVGQYTFTLANLDYRITCDVPPAGVTNFLIEIPPPIDITAVIEDVSTGEDVPEIKHVAWAPMTTASDSLPHHMRFERNPSTNKFHLRVTASEVRVRAVTRKHGQPIKVIHAHNGLEVVIELQPHLEMEFELRDGDEVIPWPLNDNASLTNAAGKREWHRSDSLDGVRRFAIRTPGAYSLQIPKIPGYLDHPPVEFIAENRPNKPFVIQLTAE